MENVNPSEIVKVVQKYTAYIKNVCRKFFIVGGTNEDLFEEGIIGLLEACKSYNGNSLEEPKFDNFAKLCIRRQIFDAIKKSNTQKNKVLNESVSFVGVNDEGDEVSKLEIITDRTMSNDPLEAVLDKEKINEQKTICDRELNEFEKQVLSHYLLGEKQSEIAAKLSKTVKSIDNTIQRIKAKLK